MAWFMFPNGRVAAEQWVWYVQLFTLPWVTTSTQTSLPHVTGTRLGTRLGTTECRFWPRKRKLQNTAQVPGTLPSQCGTGLWRGWAWLVWWWETGGWRWTVVQWREIKGNFCRVSAHQVPSAGKRYAVPMKYVIFSSGIVWKLIPMPISGREIFKIHKGSSENFAKTFF